MEEFFSGSWRLHLEASGATRSKGIESAHWSVRGLSWELLVGEFREAKMRADKGDCEPLKVFRQWPAMRAVV